MKKNRSWILRVVLVFLFVSLFSNMVLECYAKYRSFVEGTGSARVAKWAWNINSVDLNLNSSTLNINDLFSAGKIYELVNGTCTGNVDDDVKQNGDAIVAPGSCGMTSIDIRNNSEVNALYKLQFTETNNASIPIKYSLTGVDGSWKDIDKINYIISEEGAKKINMGDLSSFHLYWKWDFNDNNYSDSSFGFNGSDTVSLRISLELMQVD